MALFILGLKKCEASGIHVNEPLLNTIQDGSFWGCSRMGGGGAAKRSPYLKSVIHILY